MIKGNDLVVFKGAEMIGASKSCEINVQGETVPKASMSSAREFVGGRKSWTVMVASLLLSLSDVVSLRGKVVSLTFGVRGDGRLTGDRLTGNAIASSVRVAGTRMGLVECQITFQGSGPLQKLTVGLKEKNGLYLVSKSGERLRVLEALSESKK